MIKGFSYWNDPGRPFNKHDQSPEHREAMRDFQSRHSIFKVEKPSTKVVQTQKKENYDMLTYVINNLRLLGRQGIVMCGSSMEIGDSVSGPNSNMWQVLRAFGQEPELLSSLLTKFQTYCNADVQNGLLEIMSSSVVRTIANDVRQADWYALMIDETLDITGKEQAIICFRCGTVLSFQVYRTFT